MKQITMRREFSM